MSLRRSALVTVSHLAGSVLVLGHLAAGATGCAAGDEPSFAVSALGPPPSGSTGCDEQRWVAKMLPASTCPVAPGWNGSLAFPSPPPGLADYCVYTWGTPAIPPTPMDVAALQAAPGILATDQDCTIVGALGPVEEVNGAVRPWLRDELRNGVGAIDTLPATRMGRTPIRIDVLDTSPDDLKGTIPKGKSPHGYTVGWLAQSLACPAGPESPSCEAQVLTHLALPQVGVGEDEVNTVSGGYFGTPQQLAKAIYQSVIDWKGQAMTDRPRLVINLSLGWQPYTNKCPSYTSPELPPTLDTLDSDVVFGALLYASCHGALIVAAAGNHPGGENVDPGPTCPAAWQAVPAPAQDFCDAFVGAGYATSLPSLPLFSAAQDEERPLIYGVGGLDHRGNPITTTRPGSLGLHAAVAFQGVAGKPDSALEMPISGSSVSAAVVSGAAATLWSYAPDLTSTDVMKILYDSGSSVAGVTEDLRNQAIAGELRRVSLRGALAALCSTHPEAGCALSGAPLPSSPLQNPPIPAALSGALDAFYADGVVDQVIDFQEAAGEPFVPSEHLQSVAAPPWDHPQPIEPTCGGPCGLRVLAKRLEISINPASSVPLSNPALILHNAEGLQKVFVPDTTSLEGGFQPGQRVVFRNLPLGSFVPVRATLAFKTVNIDNAPASVTEEILLRGP